MTKKGWKQRKHKRTSIGGKHFSAGTKKVNTLWQKKIRSDEKQSRITSFKDDEVKENIEPEVKDSDYVKAVMYGLICDTEEHKQQLYDGFKEMGLHAPKIYGTFKTLAGEGGEGGRSDVVVGFHPADIGKLAVHPMHLSGGFSWHDDYWDNHSKLIPEYAKKKYFADLMNKLPASEDKRYDEEEREDPELYDGGSDDEELEEERVKIGMKKPHLKLVGEDGNAFFILGRAQRTARNAGWSKEKIDEMMKKAQSGNYDHLLQVMMEYFDVD